MEERDSAHSKPFHLITFRGEGPFAGIDLDRTGELLATEDEATYGEGGR